MPKRWTSLAQQTFLEGEIPGFLQARKDSTLYRFLPDVNERWFVRWPERIMQGEGDSAGLPLTPEEKLLLEKAIDTRKIVSLIETVEILEYLPRDVAITNMAHWPLQQE